MKLGYKEFNDTIIIAILTGIFGALAITWVFAWQEIDKQTIINNFYKVFYSIVKNEKEYNNKNSQLDIAGARKLCTSTHYDEQISICGDYYLVSPLPLGTMDSGVDYYDKQGNHLAVCWALWPFDSEEARLENLRQCNLYSKERCEVLIESCARIN